MPISNVNSSSDKGPGGGGRTTFRPPWVKETNAAAIPWSQRNTGKGKDSASAAKENGQAPTEKKEVKLQSKEIKVPVTTTKKTPVTPAATSSVSKSKEKEKEKEKETSDPVDDDKKSTGKIPVKLNKVPKPEMEKVMEPREPTGKFVRPLLKKVEKVDVPPKEKTPPPQIGKGILKKLPKSSSGKAAVNVKPEDSEEDEEEAEEEEEDEEEEESEEETETEEESSEEESTISSRTKTPEPAKSIASSSKATTPSKSPTPSILSNKSSDSRKSSEPKIVKSDGPAPPPPPPMPKLSGAAPPPPPPPPGLSAPSDFERKPISDKKRRTLEKLKIRPRKRPDWSDMMKEVESGIKLKHVKCNDRSQPILTTKSIANIKGQYIYETEKANVHNVLLKQIQSGVRLKPTRCNDRSKPVLEGLRKFRRQMTIEEQIQKSESRAQLNIAPEEDSTDEMDDIDKLRDDLQSTKQMLALELRNKEAHERENKRLMSKIQNLEAELEREKSKGPSTGSSATGHSNESGSTGSNDTLVKALKNEADEAQKTSKLLEKKYHDIAEQLDSSKSEIEEQKRQIAMLEKKLALQANGQSIDGTKTKGTGDTNTNKDSSPEPEIENSESEEDESDEKKAERIERRLVREIKMMKTKLTRLKEKEKLAKKERETLRESMKKNQGLLKIENKKYKALQKEVDKMAAMMKLDDDDDAEDGDDEKKSIPDGDADNDEGKDEAPEEEEEDESESDESEEETDNESGSESEDAPNDKKKENYEPRIKRHDGRVAALKKGNYLLQTNVDRLQDEINMMREKSKTLQADLDSVLNELE